jgi:hypothetical protein
MATPQEVETAKQEAINLAKDFANDGDAHLGFVTLYTWVYREGLPNGVTGPRGDFTEAQLAEILDAGTANLPAAA